MLLQKPVYLFVKTIYFDGIFSVDSSMLSKCNTYMCLQPLNFKTEPQSWDWSKWPTNTLMNS